MRSPSKQTSFVIVFMFSLCVAERTSAVSTKDLESRFGNKVFFIRGFYIEDKLAYDAQGNVEGSPATGPWSIAAVYVERVKIHKDNFVLEGKRTVSVRDPNQNKFVEEVPPKAERVEITVKTPADALSDSALDGLIERMFLSRITVQDVPEWWKDFFSGKQQSVSGLAPAAGGLLEFHGRNVFALRPGQQGLVAPQALFRPEPHYVEIARQAKYQGTTILNLIINKQGIPEQIQVARALGIGLDDSAVETVRRWRFSPATKDGDPVEVLISFEVNFRLY
jgi:TonB family protein